MSLENNETKTILLLEDEEQIREVVAEYLVLAGYEVIEASNAEESFDIIDDTSIDLAILDIMLPGVSGMEVLKYIKDKRDSVPVIMLSALNDEQSQLQAFNYFADDYVSKPFSPILLLKRIETILRRVSSNKTVKTEGLVLENEEYQAYYNGENLNLTLTEFQILELLMSRASKVFSREEIITYVYQGDYFGSDRVIDSHIKNLRKKLPINCIKTITGAGYQYKE